MGNATQVGAQDPEDGKPAAFEPAGRGLSRPRDGGCQCALQHSRVCTVAAEARSQTGVILAGCFRLEGPNDEAAFTGPLEVQIARPSARPATDAGATQGAVTSMLGVSEVDRTRYYREWDSLRGALAGGDTVLIRGSWLQQQHMASGHLPRRQDLPPDAIWNPEELFADIVDRTRQTPRILAISYSWLSRDHPDRNGFHLDVIAPMLQHYALHHRIGTNNLAIFIDWCSLPQRPWSDEDAKAHRRAMRTIDLWYAHTRTDVWLLSTVPGGAVPYADRGWTRLEYAAATMLCPAESVIDLGQAPRTLRSWTEIVKLCSCQRRPPQLPDDFTQELESKSFAHQEDRKVVADKYWGVFQRAIGCAEHLAYRGAGWGDADVRVLATALPQCTILAELDLRDNDIGALGGFILARVLPQCRALTKLRLSGNAIGDVVQQEIRRAWNSDPRPESGLQLEGQRPTTTTPEADKATAQALDRAERMAVAASAAGASSPTRPAAGPGSKGGDDSQQALTALMARQAAFEARITTAMAKVADGVSALSREVSSDLPPGGAVMARRRSMPPVPIAGHAIAEPELQRRRNSFDVAGPVDGDGSS